MDVATRNFLLLKLAETLGVVAVILIAGTSKGLNFRPVNFKYPQREGRVSVAISLLVLAIAALIFLSNMQLRMLEDFDWLPEQAPLARQLLVALASLGVVVLALLYRKQPFLSAGWGNRKNLALGVRIGLMLVFLTIFLRGKIMAIINGVSGQEGILLLFIVVIALAEETVFRGYLQLRFSSSLGQPTGWLATSALFVLWQLPRLLSSGEDLWMGLLFASVQSFVLGWLMHKNGHVSAPVLYRTFSEWITYLS